MKLFTSRYINRGLANWDGVKVGITVSRPRFPVGYPYKRLTLLAPFGSLFELTDEAAFRVAYYERLDSIGVDIITAAFRQLSDGGTQDVALLCFEDVTQTWCHRQVFGQWWEQQTGEVVAELPVLPACDLTDTTAKQLALW